MNDIVQQSAPAETAVHSPLALVTPTASEKTDDQLPSGHSVTATLNFSVNGPAKSNPVWVAPSQRDLPTHKNITITELRFANLAEAVWFFLPEFQGDNTQYKTARQISDHITYPNRAGQIICAQVSMILSSFKERGLTRRAAGPNPIGNCRAPGMVYKPYCKKGSIRYIPRTVQLPTTGLGKTTEYLQSHTEQVIASAAANAQELLPFGSTEPRKVDAQAWKEALSTQELPRVIDAGPVASKRAPIVTKASAERNVVVELLKSGAIHRRNLRAMYEELKEIFE